MVVIIIIDIKYHITSLVAVFLALGIGVLVGSTLIGGDVIMDQQKVLIDRLEEDFHYLRQQNRAFQEEASLFKSKSDTYKNFAQKLLPLVFKDQLTGLNVGLIKTTQEDFPPNLAATIEMAGAELPLITTVVKLEEFQAVKRAIVDNADKLNALVLIGGESLSGNAAQVEADIVKLAQELDLPLVGTSANQDTIATYQRLGLKATIDNIESPIGQTALIYSLQGQKGHYGIENTASSLIPDLDF